MNKIRSFKSVFCYIISIMRYFLLTTFLLSTFYFLSTDAHAHGNSYFQFNPDSFKTGSLYVASGGPVYQIFLPVNEFMGGFDVWFDNAGSAGPATFQLYDQNNNLVRSIQINVPTINPVSGGQKLHIDWLSQVSVIGNNKYKLKIESSLPQLRIYYSDRIGFLGHNAPYTSSYLNGVAEVGGEEKEFSFKFALYEISEGSPPILSNLAVTILSYEEAKLEFNANEPVDFKVEYNVSGQPIQTIPFSGNYTVCSPNVAKCSLILDVVPNSTYQYLLTIKDVWGNQTQQAGTFNSQALATFTPDPSATITPTPASTTQAPTPTPNVDTVPPIISNLRVAEVTNNSVQIAWETNEATNSSLLISFTSDLISIAAISDPTFELVHSLTIDGQLNPGTPYLATIRSYDSANNLASGSLNFATLASGPTPSPSPSPSPSPTSTPVTVQQNEDDPSSLDITWAPSDQEPSSGYRIDIFDANKSLIKTVNVGSDQRSVAVSGLPKGEKSVIVYTNNDGVYEKVAMPVRVQDPPFIKRLLALWPLLLVVMIMIIGYGIWKMRSTAPKPSLPMQ